AADRRGEIQGIAISRHSPRISHILFADNTIIFGHAREEAIVAIIRVLEAYELVSRQVIKFEKSSMVVSRGVGERERQSLVDVLEVQLVSKHEKYLGLPAIAGRSGAKLFQSVKERV
ncbi:UNVERIFIED_CONTAM: hypothetical protein Slati_1342600, partial [Sesamum latifolium]